MKNALLIICLTLLAAVLPSAPLRNMPVTVTQPDGTHLDLLASGDEFHNWLHDDRDYTVIQDRQTGWYTWAIREGSRLAASQYIVGEDDPAALGLVSGVNLSPRQIREKSRAFRGSFPPVRDDRVPHTGTINNLVVFIKFANSPDFDLEIPFYDNMFNNNSSGYNSMKNYFQAVSYNQLTIHTNFFPLSTTNTVVCYVDSMPREYYMPLSYSNPIGYDEDDFEERAFREFSLLSAAISFIAPQVPTTLDLDGDDDGYIDNVCFIVQGGSTAWATLLWPHMWVLYGAQAMINGSQVYTFNFQLESFLDYSGNSVLCHEMTHTLGAPDLYRYYDDTIDPIGNWDLMCGNANPPQSTCAWFKHKYLGWVPEVTTLTESGTYSLKSVWSPTNNIYRLPAWSVNEYYVLEYRKPFGIYDGNIPGTGLLIYRLNTSVDGNADGPPDELYIYRPNGINTTTNGALGMAHFSEQTGRTFMNETTLPSGFLADDSPGGLDISLIGPAGGDSITFHVNISSVQITYPKGGESVFGGAPLEITWKSRSQIGYAKLEYSVNAGQSWQTIIQSTLNDGSYIWPGLPVIDTDQCLVRVTTLFNGAVDECNGTFSILSTLAVPAPIFPLDQTTGIPTNPTFQWTASQGAESYMLQVAMDSLFNSTIINLIDLPSNSYTYNNLMPFTNYWWKVAAFASVCLSESCTPQKFTTGDISILPTVPLLTAPPNNSTNQPRNPLLRWSNANYAYYYHYQVATDFYFSNVIQENTAQQGSEVRLQPLEPNTHYYWRVRSGNPAGYSNFSSIRNFTTGETITTNADEVIALRNELGQNHPNPFSASTGINFTLKQAGEPVRLAVYNLKGQLVKVLFDGLAKSGANQVSWDGLDAAGQSAANGIYYYRLEGKGFTQTRKLLLVK